MTRGLGLPEDLAGRLVARTVAIGRPVEVTGHALTLAAEPEAALTGGRELSAEGDSFVDGVMKQLRDSSYRREPEREELLDAQAAGQEPLAGSSQQDIAWLPPTSASNCGPTRLAVRPVAPLSHEPAGST